MGLLLLVLILRWWPFFTWSGPLNDELAYTAAVRFLRAGGSPYASSGYLYPPMLAYLLRAAVETIGLQPSLLGLRLASYLGLALTAWIAVFWLPWRLRWRLLTAAAVLCLSPAVRFTTFLANLSPAIFGPILLALLLWRRTPWRAGLLLGATIPLKPLAPGALAALALQRPTGSASGRWRCLAVAVVVAVAGLLAFPGLGELLARDVSRLESYHRTVSPHRLFLLLGWRWGVVPLSLLLLLVGLWLLRRRCLTLTQLHGAAVALCLAVSPVVWSHTLLMTLPLQALALERLWRRRGGAWYRYEAALVVLACVALHLGEGATGIYGRLPLVQWFGTLVVAAAPGALAAYRVVAEGRGTPTP